MTFTITDITRCSGGGHWFFTATVKGQTKTFQIGKDELDLEPGEVREAALHRVRSALLEAGASTWQQARTALINKEFKV